MSVYDDLGLGKNSIFDCAIERHRQVPTADRSENLSSTTLYFFAIRNRSITRANSRNIRDWCCPCFKDTLRASRKLVSLLFPGLLSS